MNVQTIEVDQALAAERYKEYLQATNRTTLDEQSKRIYRAIARGNRVVNLCEAMRLAGTNHLYRPRLAVARAGNGPFQRRWTLYLDLVNIGGLLLGAVPGRIIGNVSYRLNKYAGFVLAEVEKQLDSVSPFVRLDVVYFVNQVASNFCGWGRTAIRCVGILRKLVYASDRVVTY